MGECETRTQGAPIAQLWARLRTQDRAAQRGRSARASFRKGLLVPLEGYFVCNRAYRPVADVAALAAVEVQAPGAARWDPEAQRRAPARMNADESIHSLCREANRRDLCPGGHRDHELERSAASRPDCDRAPRREPAIGEPSGRDQPQSRRPRCAVEVEDQLVPNTLHARELHGGRVRLDEERSTIGSAVHEQTAVGSNPDLLDVEVVDRRAAE